MKWTTQIRAPWDRTDEERIAGARRHVRFHQSYGKAMIAVMLFLTAAAFATIGYLFHFATNGPPDDRFATASELSIGFVTGMALGLIGAFSLVCAILFTYASLVEAHQAALLVNTWDKLKQIEGEAA